MGMGNFMDPGGMAGGLLAGGSLANMAVGRISIDTSSLTAARTVVVREAKLMGDTLQQVGDRTDRGVTQATGALKRLETGIESARSRASLLLAAFVTGGIAAAQSVKSLELRMVALSGSEQQAAEHMETLRKQADAAGQPFLTLVEGAAGLLPALRGTNADLGQTVMLAQRLAMMDPAQGVTGASFAIREFLNGEYISLTRRLELDRTRLREILAEADGDAQKAIDGLSRYVDEIGISERQLTEMGKEGAYAFAVLRDEVKQTMADAFTPFLNNALIPIFRTLNDILRVARQINPELLGIAGTAAGLYGVGSVAHRGLPIIGAIPGGERIARGAVTAGSMYVGAQLGAGLVRGVANLGGAGVEHFRGTSQSEALSMLTESLKQVGVLFVKMLGEIVIQGGIAGYKLQNAFDVVVAAIKWGGSQLVDAFSRIIEVFATIPALLAQQFLEAGGALEPGGLMLGTLAGEMYDAADGVRALMGETEEYERTILRGIGLTIEQQKSVELASKSIDESVLSLGRWLGVIDEGTRGVAAFEAQFFSTMVEGINKAFDAIRPPETDLKITDDLLDEWASFQDELADIDRQEKEDLRQEDRKYRAGVLNETRQYNEAVAQEVERYNEQVASVEQDYAQQRARAAESYHERVAETEASYAERRASALENFQQQEAEIRAGLSERITEAEITRQERATDLITQYNDRREDLQTQHEDRMLQIQRQARRDIARAAMRLDAEGIWAARVRAKDQREDEQKGFESRLEDLDEWLRESQVQEETSYAKRLDESRRAADKQLAALRTRYQREEQEARATYDKQLADLRTRYLREEQLARENRAARLAELATQHQRELAEMQVAHNNELVELRTQHMLRMGEIQRQAFAERQAVEQAFIQTFNAIQISAGGHQSTMIGIQQWGQAQMEADLRAWWERMKGIVSTPVYQYQAPIMQSPTQWVPPGGRYINPYQTGGKVMRTGVGRVEEEEYILRPDVTRALDRMLGGNMTQAALLSAVSGRGARGDVQVNGMTIPISLELSGSARDAAQDVGAAVEAKVYELLVELGA